MQREQQSCPKTNLKKNTQKIPSRNKNSSQKKNNPNPCCSNCSSRASLAICSSALLSLTYFSTHRATEALKIERKTSENGEGDTEYPKGLKTIFQINWTESKQRQLLASAQHLVSVFISAVMPCQARTKMILL